MSDTENNAQQSYRDHLVSARENASRDYDKAVLTLAAGALVISITFIHNIAPHPKDTAFVLAAWLLLAATLVIVVISLLTSQSALLGAINDHDAHKDSGKQRGMLMTVLNIAAGSTFILGVVSLIVFAVLNLNAV
jgi:hypothetical protein